jgi:predicted nucleic acid-binding protein
LRLVVDASVAVEYLLRTALGRSVAPRIEQAELLAPELLDAEVLAVLRRAHLAGRLGEARAREATRDLCDWPVRRLTHRPLLALAWSLRKNLSAYDALYVAAARLYDAHLLTADGPLSRAPRTGVVIENVRV